jgi:hypothetical protein
MVDARDAAVGAIVAAAGGLVVGFVKLTASGWLVSNPAFGLRGWQILTVGAFAVNVVSVSVPGRVDGEMAETAKKAGMAAKRAAKMATKQENTTDTNTTHETTPEAGIPRAHWSRGLFSPAGWAFAIWGPIFVGESAFASMAAVPGVAVSNPVASAMLAHAAPWFACACLLQSLWCVSFRPWAKRPRHFWLPAFLLSAEAVALRGAHNALLFAAASSPPLSIGTYLCCHLPVAMHFGWITCASLVSLNSWVAVARWAPGAKLTLAFASTLFATTAAAFVSVTTGDPVVSFVVAWALAAVAVDGGKNDKSEEFSVASLTKLTNAASIAAKALTALGGLLIARNVFSSSA